MSLLRSRQLAAIAGHRGDETAARALLNDSDAQVRATALQALHRMKCITSQDVRNALLDDAPEVRKRAVALAIPFTEIDLTEFLADRQTLVAEQAAWALGERQTGSATVEPLCAAATTHPDDLVREAAVAALGAIADLAAVPTILAALEDKPAVRRRAVLALSPFEGPHITAALQRMLRDRDWQVRQAAEELLN